MTITVAGNKKDVAEGLTVAQLVIDENVETPQYVTVTINDEFVSGAFESTVLKDGDVVEFLLLHGRRTVMAFTDEQLERYSRHIILKEVGAKGQKSSLTQRYL